MSAQFLGSSLLISSAHLQGDQFPPLTFSSVYRGDTEGRCEEMTESPLTCCPGTYLGPAKRFLFKTLTSPACWTLGQIPQKKSIGVMSQKNTWNGTSLSWRNYVLDSHDDMGIFFWKSLNCVIVTQHQDVRSKIGLCLCSFCQTCCVTKTQSGKHLMPSIINAMFSQFYSLCLWQDCWQVLDGDGTGRKPADSLQVNLGAFRARRRKDHCGCQAWLSLSYIMTLCPQTWPCRRQGTSCGSGLEDQRILQLEPGGSGLCHSGRDI